MNLLAFCDRIELAREGTRRLKEINIQETEYHFVRFACETYEIYQEKVISQDIYWDTFTDIRFWCENCQSEYGEYGIHQYDWLFRHIELKLFRLGRLQFEMMEAEEDRVWENGHIRKGDDVINVHIPQGEALDTEKCRQSFKRAYAVWGEERPFICHSWLLNPGLGEILGKDSNILKFQQFCTAYHRKNWCGFRKNSKEHRPSFAKYAGDHSSTVDAKYERPFTVSVRRSGIYGDGCGNGYSRGIYEDHYCNCGNGIHFHRF